MTQLIDNIRGLVNQGISAEESTDDEPREIAGYPVITEDGERLGFENPEAGNDSIHIAKLEDPREVNSRGVPTSHTWSACRMGSLRAKQEENAIYLSPGEVTEEYLVRDGEVIGKVCGNCRKAIQS